MTDKPKNSTNLIFLRPENEGEETSIGFHCDGEKLEIALCKNGDVKVNGRLIKNDVALVVAFENFIETTKGRSTMAHELTDRIQRAGKQLDDMLRWSAPETWPSRVQGAMETMGYKP